MSTKIQWTDETWNPTTGCTRVSEGCRNCYIERTPAFRIPGRKFVGGTTGVLLHPDRLDKPRHWHKHRMIFVNSLSDLFHDEIPDDFLDQVFDVMEEGASDYRNGFWSHKPNHTYQVLTKRPTRMVTYVTKRLAKKQAYADSFKDCPTPEMRDSPAARYAQQCASGKFYTGIWLGVSIEDQATADERIPILLQTPAAVRWISAEPLLGPVDIMAYTYYGSKVGANRGLDWVVCGGESGPGARCCRLDWIRAIRMQCEKARVPVFVKQLGAKPFSLADHLSHPHCKTIAPDGFYRFLNDKKGGDISEFPLDLQVREYPHG